MLLAVCVSCTKDPVISSQVVTPSTATSTASTGSTTGTPLQVDYRDQWVGTYYSQFDLVYSTNSVTGPSFAADTTVYDSVKVFHNTAAPVIKLYPLYRFDGVNCGKDTLSISVDTTGNSYISWGGGSVGYVSLNFQPVNHVKYGSSSTQWSGTGNSVYNKTTMSGIKQ